MSNKKLVERQFLAVFICQRSISPYPKRSFRPAKWVKATLKKTKTPMTAMTAFHLICHSSSLARTVKNELMSLWVSLSSICCHLFYSTDLFFTKQSLRRMMHWRSFIFKIASGTLLDQSMITSLNWLPMKKKRKRNSRKKVTLMRTLMTLVKWTGKFILGSYYTR